MLPVLIGNTGAIWIRAKEQPITVGHGNAPSTGDAAVAIRNLSGSSGSRVAVVVETEGMSGRAMS